MLDNYIAYLGSNKIYIVCLAELSYYHKLRYIELHLMKKMFLIISDIPAILP